MLTAPTLIGVVLTASMLVGGELGRPDRDATQTYESMLAKPAIERAQMFRLLSPSMKSAVWRRHLLTALVEHDEFTNEQRAVIQDALALLTPELFEIEESSSEWRERVDQPLQQLTRRAKTLFDPKLARELFAQLGPDGSREAEKTDLPTCECSIFSDFCDNSGLGVYYCSQSGGCYFRTSGCGTFWQYACNGMCRMRPL